MRGKKEGESRKKKKEDRSGEVAKKLFRLKRLRLGGCVLSQKMRKATENKSLNGEYTLAYLVWPQNRFLYKKIVKFSSIFSS